MANVTKRINSSDRDAFNALFTNVRQSWFRLETLQMYNAGEHGLATAFSHPQ